MGQAVLNGEANRAWQEAESRDRLGALQVPEIRQAVWEGVQSILQTGQPVNSEVIINLRNIHFANHQEKQPVNGQSTQSSPPQMPPWGSPPMSGNHPQRVQSVDPRAAKHTLDADTQRAINTVIGFWPKKGAK
jgi:hypothetical protein